MGCVGWRSRRSGIVDSDSGDLFFFFFFFFFFVVVSSSDLSGSGSGSGSEEGRCEGAHRRIRLQGERAFPSGSS